MVEEVRNIRRERYCPTEKQKHRKKMDTNKKERRRREIYSEKKYQKRRERERVEKKRLDCN